MSGLIANLRIWQKSLFPIALLAVISGGTTLHMLSAMTQTDDRFSTLLANDARAAIWMARANSILLDTGRLGWRSLGEPTEEGKKKALADLTGLRAEFMDRFGKARAAITDPGMLADLPAIERNYAAVLAAVTEASQISVGGDHNTAARVMIEKYNPPFVAARTASRAIVDRLIQGTEKQTEDLNARTGATIQTSIILAAVGLALSLALGIWISVKGIIQPIRVLTGAMTRLANRDWTTDVPGLTRADELGAMAKTVNIFKTSGQDADRLTAEQETLKTRAESDKRQAMLKLAGEFEAKVGKLVEQVASAANELQTTAQSMTNIVDDTTRRTSSVAAAAEEASTNVQTVAAAAEELATSVAEITRQVAQSAKLTSEAVDASKRTDGVVRALADGAQKIGEVVSLISNIAGQTNLLALNATIEAARAGDAGKGFAVVASEVKGLATETAKATEQISQQVAQMQAATQEAVDSIRGIGAKIGEVSEIARNVQQAAEGTQDVTTNIVGVSDGTSNIGAAATQVLGAAQGLSRQAVQLSGEVDQFMAEVKAA